MVPFENCPVTLLLVFIVVSKSHVTASKAAAVPLPYGTFQGFNVGNLTKFLGILFAHVGWFEAPNAPTPLYGVQNATDFGPACPQQAVPPLLGSSTLGAYPSISEDCGFEIGNSRDQDVVPLLERSIETREPMIIVTPNYCLTLFGFLGGREVGSAEISNLGLRDRLVNCQRSCLQRFTPFNLWVQKEEQRGGQSTGTVSTVLLSLSNKQNSNTLFHGPFMVSGSPTKSASPADGQADHDSLVAVNNCTASADTLGCLRRIPLEVLMAAVNETPNILSYQSLSLLLHPHIDRDVLMEDPMVSVACGSYALILLMTGDCDDEGTTNAGFLDYMHNNYLPPSLQADIAQIGTLYPEDPAQGDLVFLGPRRFLLEHASATQDARSWLSKLGKNTPIVGAFHTSDTGVWFLTNVKNRVAGRCRWNQALKESGTALGEGRYIALSTYLGRR
ncbi:Alpha/Beta hydrolase protein [Mycena rosella]|uniref:Alpha/Beta hydrolase protein n=1 Tax=Mycena rosella TaxID=1033263 RepID=A0AAD7H061_MYCRO|nr:Alpha/Beta hydrolase protein [Mycena rosella]